MADSARRMLLWIGMAFVLVLTIVLAGYAGPESSPGSLRAQVASCGNGVIEGTEDCDGGACCSASCTIKAAGTACRGLGGPCDVQESCTGVGADCPSDAFLTAARVCRPALGVCDAEEYCPGDGAECPDDAFKGSYIVCREAAGECDVEELCPGDDTKCPSDVFAPTSTVCRAASGSCPAASCTGSAAACPEQACVQNAQPQIAAIAEQTSKPLQAVNVLVNAADPDGDVLTLEATGLPPGVMVQGLTLAGAIRRDAANMDGSYAPSRDGRAYTATLTVRDGRGGIASTVVQWNVAPLRTRLSLESACACGPGITACAQYLANHGPDPLPLVEIRGEVANAQYFREPLAPEIYSFVPPSSVRVGTGSVARGENSMLWRSAAVMPAGTAMAFSELLVSTGDDGSHTLSVETPYSLQDGEGVAPLRHTVANDCPASGAAPGAACAEDQLLFVLAPGERGKRQVQVDIALSPCVDARSITALSPSDCRVEGSLIRCAALPLSSYQPMQPISFLAKVKANCPIGFDAAAEGIAAFSDGAQSRISPARIRICACGAPDCSPLASDTASAWSLSPSASSSPVAQAGESSVSAASAPAYDSSIGPPTIARCGDHVIEAPETCDDGNMENEDGCSEFCQREAVCAVRKRIASALATGQPAMDCVDSDGGIDPFVNGVVQAGNRSFADACAGDLLVEHACAYYLLSSPGSPVAASRYQVTRECDCGRVCRDGACVRITPEETHAAAKEEGFSLPVESCSDSDGGDHHRAGTTVVGRSAFIAYADVCRGRGDIDEFSCEATGSGTVRLVMRALPCESGTCVDGACVARPSATEE